MAEKASEDKTFSVSGVLKQLKLSKSGYYDWMKRKPSPQSQRKERVQQRIEEIYDENHQIYGAPKITHLLQEEGEKISERTVSVYMREMGIKAVYIKPYCQTTKDCDYSQKLQNVLDRDFSPSRANEAWCTDITYIRTEEDGFVYLTSIMDLFSRRIIAWTLSRTMKVEDVLECLKQAKMLRNVDKPLVIQSDRGSQFVSSMYVQLTEGMTRSYSDKGTPWDNACIESFHALIKREWLDRRKLRNYADAYHSVFEYIETFYNTVRIHSHNDYRSPKQREELLQN